MRRCLNPLKDISAHHRNRKYNRGTMKNNLFRKKNIDKMASPENLDAFLRVTNPSMWLAFAAIVVVLFGAIVWSFTGTIESTAKAVIVSDNEKTVCYVSEKNITEIKAGMTVRVGSDKCAITGGSPDAVLTDAALSDYAMELGGFQSGEYLYELTVDKTFEPGNYQCEIIIESLHPIDFLG